MSEHRDPPRWLASPPADLRESVAIAAREHRAERPHPQQRDRMWEQLERQLPTAGVQQSWSWSWVGIGAVLLIGTGAAVLWPKSQQSIASPPPIAAEATLAAAKLREVVPVELRRISASTSAAEPPLIPTSTPRAAALAVPAAEPQRIPPSVPAPAKPRPQVATHTPSRKLPGHAATGDSLAAPARVDPPPSAAGVATSNELQLLVRARRLVRSAPARALELTEQHRSKFPHGMFVEERELLGLEALASLGRRDLVVQRAQSFRATFPASPHRRRVETLSGSE